jgi:hypothetical protein
MERQEECSLHGKNNLTMDLNLSLIHTLTTVLRHTSNTYVMITNVYGPQTDNLRSALYEELRLIRMLNDLPWVVIGDFNLLRSNNETSGAPRPLSQINDFNDILQELHLTKVPLQGRKYTYSNGRPQPTLSKLDRVFLSQQWNTGPLANLAPVLTDLPNATSDHAPLKLSFTPMTGKPRCPFRFERYWMKFEETEQIVQHIWNLSGMPTNNTKRLMTRLKLLRT